MVLFSPGIFLIVRKTLHRNASVKNFLYSLGYRIFNP